MIAIFYEWKCSDFTNGHFRILPLYLFLDLCFQCWYYIPITEQARTLCPCKGPFLDNIFDLRPSAFATLIVIMIEPMCSFLLRSIVTKYYKMKKLCFQITLIVFHVLTFNPKSYIARMASLFNSVDTNCFL